MDNSWFLAIIGIEVSFGMLLATEVLKSCGHIEDVLRKQPSWNGQAFPTNVGAIEANTDWGRVVRAFYVELGKCKRLVNLVMLQLIAFVIFPIVPILAFSDTLKAFVLLGPVSGLLVLQLICIVAALVWMLRVKAYKQRRDDLDDLVRSVQQ
jgi:hypothetical protein